MCASFISVVYRQTIALLANIISWTYTPLNKVEVGLLVSACPLFYYSPFSWKIPFKLSSLHLFLSWNSLICPLTEICQQYHSSNPYQIAVKLARDLHRRSMLDSFVHGKCDSITECFVIWLTHWGQDQMAPISQTTISNAIKKKKKW